MSKFIVKQTKTGFNFSLLAKNGQIIATSQVYKSLKTCKNGINSVMTNAPIANVEDQTVDGYDKQKNPKFEVYVDKSGEFRFRLKAKNGQNIASSEGYKAKKSCMNGIDSVVKNAPIADISQAES